MRQGWVGALTIAVMLALATTATAVKPKPFEYRYAVTAFSAEGSLTGNDEEARFNGTWLAKSSWKRKAKGNAAMLAFAPGERLFGQVDVAGKMRYEQDAKIETHNGFVKCPKTQTLPLGRVMSFVYEWRHDHVEVGFNLMLPPLECTTTNGDRGFIPSHMSATSASRSCTREYFDVVPRARFDVRRGAHVTFPIKIDCRFRVDSATVKETWFGEVQLKRVR